MVRQVLGLEARQGSAAPAPEPPEVVVPTQGDLLLRFGIPTVATSDLDPILNWAHAQKRRKPEDHLFEPSDSE